MSGQPLTPAVLVHGGARTGLPKGAFRCEFETRVSASHFIIPSLAAVDDWRFGKRMPSRAAAVRELLKRGLAAEGVSTAKNGSRSKDYGVIGRRKTCR